jgi:hypothetical protein
MRDRSRTELLAVQRVLHIIGPETNLAKQPRSLVG